MGCIGSKGPATEHSSEHWHAEPAKALGKFVNKVDASFFDPSESGLDYFHVDGESASDDCVELREMLKEEHGREVLSGDDEPSTLLVEMWWELHCYHHRVEEQDGESHTGLWDCAVALHARVSSEPLPSEVESAALSCREAVDLVLSERDDSRSPPRELFLKMQTAIFTALRPRLALIKADGHYDAFLAWRRQRINHVEEDDFEYLKVLGEGGFGHVVMVRKKSTGRYYALKIQAKDTLIASWRKRRERVVVERDVLVAERNFPFIVAVHYAFQTDRHAVLVLDLAVCSLENVLRADGLADSEARLLVAEITLGLEHLHFHGVVYRDLKPANVLVANDGHVMLADMGLAVYDNSFDTDFDHDVGCVTIASEVQASGAEPPVPPPHTTTLARRNTLCGTPLFRAPEMIGAFGKAWGVSAKASRGSNQHMFAPSGVLNRLMQTPPKIQYNEKVDFFALGVTMYLMLCGCMPREPDPSSDPDDFDEIAERKLWRPGVKAIKFPPHLSEKAISLIQGLLAYDPEVRFGAAEIRESAFFHGLAGIGSTSTDWECVLNKAYKPFYEPNQSLPDVPEHPEFSCFTKVVKHFKKRAEIGDAFKNEGGAIRCEDQMYFDGWDYVAAECVQAELEAVERGYKRTKKGKRLSNRFKMAIIGLSNREIRQESVGT